MLNLIVSLFYGRRRVQLAHEHVLREKDRQIESLKIQIRHLQRAEEG